ncbi:uncharacterized protein UDID_04256 [Ustilago sp. UG-2017a]|nr:uncharacterized protein UDID_04256 [Ustilago sp. UG-2017a]
MYGLALHTTLKPRCLSSHWLQGRSDWGRIINGIPPELTAVRYHDWIIDGPFCDAMAASAYPDGLSVVEDGSSCRQAGICKQWRSEYNIQTQEDPPASPDLNPIENIRFVVPLSSDLDELSTGDPSHAQQEEACWMWPGKLPWID